VRVPISDEVAQKATAEHEDYLDRFVSLYRDLKTKDIAGGDSEDMGALGGISMAVDVIGVPSVKIMLALAVRRLAEQ
jgi:hypothetical protein